VDPTGHRVAGEYALVAQAAQGFVFSLVGAYSDNEGVKVIGVCSSFGSTVGTIAAVARLVPTGGLLSLAFQAFCYVPLIMDLLLTRY
jgi:hypothetical protein